MAYNQSTTEKHQHQSGLLHLINTPARGFWAGILLAALLIASYFAVEWKREQWESQAYQAGYYQWWTDRGLGISPARSYHLWRQEGRVPPAEIAEEANKKANKPLTPSPN